MVRNPRLVASPAIQCELFHHFPFPYPPLCYPHCEIETSSLSPLLYQLQHYLRVLRVLVPCTSVATKTFRARRALRFLDLNTHPLGFNRSSPIPRRSSRSTSSLFRPYLFLAILCSTGPGRNPPTITRRESHQISI